MTQTAWPKSDQRAANLEDLLILVRRGMSVTSAAGQLGIPFGTAYRWAREAGVRLEGDR